MKSSGLLVFACAAALSVGCNGHGNRSDNSIANGTANGNAAVDTSGAAGTAGNGVSNSDRTFVNDQLSGGMAEVELGKMATMHAASQDVKDFARMMIDDHTKAGDQLKQVAMSNNITPQPEVDKKHQDLMDKLSKLQGPDFDKQYMSAMVDDHEGDVKDVRSRVDEDRSVTDRLKGNNPENPGAIKPKTSDDRVTMSVNQWAANVLPTLEHHLDRAKQIKDNLDHSRNNRTQ
jgi:putative membrane protein